MVTWIAIGLVMAAVSCGRNGEGLVIASKRAVADDTHFVTSLGASQVYSDVAATLLESAKRCEARRRPGDARCTARSSAAGLFQVMSLEVVGCDAAGRAKSRLAARAALRTVDQADHDRGRKPPLPPPALPRC
jgi:hypothetical protein